MGWDLKKAIVVGNYEALATFIHWLLCLPYALGVMMTIRA
jgi:hypothetical protein